MTVYLIIRLALDAVFLHRIGEDPGYVQAVLLSDIAKNGEGRSLRFSSFGIALIVLTTFFMSSHSNILHRWIGRKLQPCISLKYAWDTWLWCARSSHPPRPFQPCLAAYLPPFQRHNLVCAAISAPKPGPHLAGAEPSWPIASPSESSIPTGASPCGTKRGMSSSRPSAAQPSPSGDPPDMRISRTPHLTTRTREHF